jgi:uncharacterized protein
MNGMRVIALEEHVSFQQFSSTIDPALIAARGFTPGRGAGGRTAELDDTEGERLRLMDEAGIDVQVLSIIGPGADLLPADAAPDFARRYNDELATVVRKHPDRFSGFANLPLTAPEKAAEELTRCVREHGFLGALVNGHTGGKFLDDPSFEPVLAEAEALDVPIYIHPGIPPESVRKAYYDGFDPGVSFVFACAGWGWHAETAVHVLRLVLSGALDRHPKLRIIIGHMGEGLPAMLDRCDHTLGPVARNLKRTVSETILDQVTITISGFFSFAPFIAALLTFGADRIMFSVDYPFAENIVARKFFDGLPVTPSDKKLIAHKNAERILKLT